MTVAEFRQLPESGPFYYELRHGEPVPVTRPKAKHYRIQLRLQHLLERAAPPGGLVGIELAFRPVPEYELRVADVAYLRQERWEQVDPDDNVSGAPELVIEVLSPSNTAAELYEKEKMCLDHGCLEFWVVDPDRRQVKVATPDGITATFQAGQKIPLQVLGGGFLEVGSIFA